jgi:hypothetical protein
LINDSFQAMVGRISGIASESDDSVPALALNSGPTSSGALHFAMMNSCSPRHSGILT